MSCTCCEQLALKGMSPTRLAGKRATGSLGHTWGSTSAQLLGKLHGSIYQGYLCLCPPPHSKGTSLKNVLKGWWPVVPAQAGRSLLRLGESRAKTASLPKEKDSSDPQGWYSELHPLLMPMVNIQVLNCEAGHSTRKGANVGIYILQLTSGSNLRSRRHLYFPEARTLMCCSKAENLQHSHINNGYRRCFPHRGLHTHTHSSTLRGICREPG